MQNDFQKQIFHIFIEEFEENIDKIDEILFNDVFSKDEINALFRIFHSIKGSAGFAGLEEIKDFSHIIENLFQEIRNDNIKVDDNVKDLIYSLAELFKKVSENLKINIEPFSQIEDIKKRLIDRCNSLITDKEKNSNIFIIKYRPPENIFFQGLDPLVFIRDLKKFCEIDESKVILDRLNNLSLVEFKPNKFYLEWEIQIKTNKTIDEIKAIFEFIDFEDKGHLYIDKKYDFKIDEIKPKIEENIIANIYSETNVVIEKEKQEESNNKQVNVDLIEFKDIEKSFIKVNSFKIDNLINLFKDISILSSIQIYNIENNYFDNFNEIKNITSRLHKMILESQQQVLELKMVPVKNYLIPLKKKIENLAKQLNKKVKFIIDGLEEEIDKQIIDNILEPIEHLLRNAVDHGIEEPEIRKKKNKNEDGEIKLKIYKKKSNTYVEISDDGKGIDKNAILRKAISMNLINESDAINVKENDIYNFIFYPGFSTKNEISEISGRGVGLDVVKESLNKLNGKIEIISEIDKGTTFSLQLPLILAVIDCMIFTINNIYFAIPITSIKNIFFSQTQKLLDDDNYIVSYKDEYVGMINIFESLNFNKNSDFDYQKSNLFLLIEINNKLKAYYCDEIIGQQSLVVNSIFKNTQKLKGISGTSILGNGEICFILDPEEITVKEHL